METAVFTVPPDCDQPAHYVWPQAQQNNALKTTQQHSMLRTQRLYPSTRNLLVLYTKNYRLHNQAKKATKHNYLP